MTRRLYRLTFLERCWIRRHRSRHRTVGIANYHGTTVVLTCVCGKVRAR